MAIENRNLEVGTRLVANYRKQRFVCTVEKAEDGEGVVFKLEDGKSFKSLSSAGSSVMGGKAVNGWKFWTLEGDAKTAPAKDNTKPAKKSGKAKTTKLISRIPNQKGLEEGSYRYWCAGCMNSFISNEPEPPQVCPEGHRADDPELIAAAPV